jgi:hypothetical protein
MDNRPPKDEGPEVVASKASKESATDSGSKHNKPRTKRHSILLVLASGRSLNRFEAEHLMDHCLNTTISEIGRYDGIIVSRQFEKHESRAGHPFRCCRYWLHPNQQAKALRILGVDV